MEKSNVQKAKEEARAKRDEGRALVADAVKADFPIGTAVEYSKTTKHAAEVKSHEGPNLVLSDGVTVPAASVRLAK